ncbi:M23 family metallopeptidase [Abyssisolibacter fermentans]|uniref:M23 family metallopeptidase n=1 Tax=Abyssisolibacter fermentans TaxID=1766203 RepID=UPI0008315685|nr:M23 family metallopeptidase [Abyssisolibacter fermentans]
MNIDYSRVADRLKKLINRKTCLKLSIFLMIGILCGTTIRVLNDKREYDTRKELETRAFNVIFGNKEIGIVRKQETVVKLLEDIQDSINKDYNCDTVIKQKLEFKNTHVESNELTSVSKLKKSILSTLSFNVHAYAIKVNGNNIGLLKTKEEANNILNNIKEPYIERIEAENGKLEEINLLEKIEIVEQEQPLANIIDYEELLNYIRKGTTEEKTHTVKEGESLWSISKKYNISVSDLEKANPQFVNGYLHIDDKLSLIVPKPFITVVTKEQKTFLEKIGFETEYEETSSLYKDETRVKRRGIYGEKEVVALVEKQNGVEMGKDVISETITANPKPQLVVRGTKEIPPLKGTGIFKRPTSGRLTSRYGPRWGSFHKGIDLASRTGTPIKAADGGVVTFAGYKGTYGYMVEISHGGGYKTRYAHCSKIYVKKGDKVYKDKTIAAVGNTGRSTGPHVHFEVLKYDKNQDPLKYINKKYR